MLTLEQIIYLQEKGFSFEQMSILNSMNMGTPANEPKPESEKPEPEKPESEKPEPEKPNPEKPEPEKPEPESDRVKALEDEIGKLTDTIKAMQSANVHGAKAEPKKIESAEDIIKSFMVAS